jgi:hypothetical protein
MMIDTFWEESVSCLEEIILTLVNPPLSGCICLSRTLFSCERNIKIPQERVFADAPMKILLYVVDGNSRIGCASSGKIPIGNPLCVNCNSLCRLRIEKIVSASFTCSTTDSHNNKISLIQKLLARMDI